MAKNSGIKRLGPKGFMSDYSGTGVGVKAGVKDSAGRVHQKPRPVAGYGVPQTSSGSVKVTNPKAGAVATSRRYGNVGGGAGGGNKT